jgi:subtilisin family serine protease
MSFGKAYSKHQQAVYDAMAYADSKGVLLVHAAGNDGENLDENSNFPTNQYAFQTKPLDMYLCIGASTRFSKNLAAAFSNYSPKQVDVFAPGFEIYNTVPQSDYKVLQGTSMAAPMVSGVAAMLKSYFPSLSMKEIKDIMLASAKSYKGSMVAKPGAEQTVDFGTLSTTGAVIDVTAAVKMCKAKVAK